MKRTISIFLILITIFIPSICHAQPVSRIFNAGIYDLGSANNYTAKIHSTNDDGTSQVLIFNSDNYEKFSYRFSSLDKSELNIKLEDNDTLIVVGKGTVAIIFEKTS